MNWLIDVLGRFPTTQGRIVSTMVLVYVTAGRYLVAGVPGASKDGSGIAGWNSWLILLAALAGLDVGQYFVKRGTDIGLATARNANNQPNVTVEAPSKVIVQPAPAVAAEPAAPVVEPVTARSFVPITARGGDVPEVAEGSIVAGPQPKPIARDD